MKIFVDGLVVCLNHKFKNEKTDFIFALPKYLWYQMNNENICRWFDCMLKTEF